MIASSRGGYDRGKNDQARRGTRPEATTVVAVRGNEMGEKA